MSGFSVIDNSQTTAFHRKLLVACCGGPFLDGYVISVIGVALVGAQTDLHLTTNEAGLIGAASLVGILIGATLFGALTDRIGREKMYALDLIVLVLSCFACAIVTSPWQLIAARLVLGVAIGADYPIATSLLTEFTPTRKRGFMIGLTALAWSFGAMFAFLIGGLIVQLSGGYELWRWMLASGGVLGIIVVLCRRGIPESPRWLLRQGRQAEAEQVIERVFGRSVSLSEEKPETNLAALESLKIIFRGGYAKRTFVCGMLYLAQITPQYAIYTFGPTMLRSFGIAGQSLDIIGSAVISMLFALGCVPALNLVETRGRRIMCVAPFAIMAVPLFALALWPTGPAWFIIGAFCLYAFASGGPSILEWIYPNELFPTQVRATAVGVAVGISRVGAASGTYLLPLSIASFGTGTTMLFGAILTLAGFLTCLVLAPETKGIPLESVSSLNSGT